MIDFDKIKACVFDAYGTLFDVNAAAMRLQPELGDKAVPLAAAWRAKQLEYTWLRSLMDGTWADFWQVTQDALDYAIEELGIDTGLRQRLLDLYRALDCYPEVPAVLSRLKKAKLDTAILSNASPDMLRAAVDSAGLGQYLDALLSVDPLKTYKPGAPVYRLVEKQFDIAPGEVCFLSSNGWDAAGAAQFGFQTVWVNRQGKPVDRLPSRPAETIVSLDGLPPLLGL